MELDTVMLILSVTGLVVGLWMKFSEVRREAEQSPSMIKLRELEREIDSLFPNKPQ